MARQPADKASPPVRRTFGFAQRVARLWAGAGQDTDSPWLPKDGSYPHLRGFDVIASGLTGQTGLYACWHRGVRPQWVRVGAAIDLGAAIVGLQQQAEIAYYDANGGLFLAWAQLPAETLPGAVGFLIAQLKPAFQSPVLAAEVLPAAIGTTFPFPPGTYGPVPQTAQSQP